MFVSMVNKDYPVLYFEEKSASDLISCQNVFGQIQDLPHQPQLSTILHRQYGYIVINNTVVQ